MLIFQRIFICHIFIFLWSLLPPRICHILHLSGHLLYRERNVIIIFWYAVPNTHWTVKLLDTFHNEKSYEIYKNQNPGVSNVNTFFVEKYAIDKNFRERTISPQFKCLNCNDCFWISLTVWEYIAKLQEMFTILREMSVNQVYTVCSFPHVWFPESIYC